MKKLVLMLILPLFVFAMDLSTLLEKVQSNDLVQSKQSLKAAQQKALENIQSSYMPKVTTTGMYSYLRDEDQGLFDPKTNVSINASYLLFDGFKHSDLVKAQKYRLQASGDVVEFEKERLSLEAVKLYFNLHTQKVLIDATKQKIKQLENEVARLTKLYDAKIVAEDILESVKASLAMSEYDLQLQKQAFSHLRFSLQALCGTNFDLVEKGNFKDVELVSSVMTKDILAKEKELNSLQWQGSAQTSSYLPQVLIKDSYGTTQYYDSSISFAGLSLPESQNKLEVLLSWTLLDFGAQSKAKQKIYLEKKAKNEELNFYKKSLKSRQDIATMQLSTSKAKIRSALQNLKASQKSFEFREKRFKANLIDSTIFLDALTRFTQAKALYEQSQNDYEIAKADYYFNHNISLQEKLL